MKNIKMTICCLLLGGLMVGCSNNSVDTFANVSNENQTLNTSKGEVLTVGTVYDYIRENENSNIAKSIMIKIMEDQLDLSNQDNKNLYLKYLNDYFKTTFIDSGSYDYDGEFDEELLVKYLKSEGYTITCDGGDNLLDEPFTCNYTNYIEQEVNYDIYLKMLKIQYILNNDNNLIDKSQSRKISYYSVKRSSTADYETRENLENNLVSISENYNSDNEELIRDLEDIANLNRKKDLEELNTQYEKVSTSNDTTFTYLNKFTTCGDKKCTLEEGKTYQDSLVLSKDYLVTTVVNKNNSEVLYEEARDVLFSKNINNYLYEIGNAKYLISPAYINDEVNSMKDVILFDSSTSTYYIVIVEVLDSNTENFDDKVSMAELLIDNVSVSNVLDYYFEKSEVEIYDKNIRELFISTYGEFSKED